MARQSTGEIELRWRVSMCCACAFIPNISSAYTLPFLCRREIRLALADVMIRQRGKPLTSEQEEVFRRCRLLEENQGESWRKIYSANYDVDMHMKHFDAEEGERSLDTGRAVGVVDCSAEELSSWLFDFCSKERMRISQENGHPARVVIRSPTNSNEVVVATVKKMPVRASELRTLISFYAIIIFLTFICSSRSRTGSSSRR